MATTTIPMIPPTTPTVINPIRKLTIHLNSVAVPGWNEIDAVGLIATTGELQWAKRATASSAYGAPAVTGGIGWLGKVGKVGRFVGATGGPPASVPVPEAGRVSGGLGAAATFSP